MDEDIKIRIAEISEALKYLNRRVDLQDQEIKSLHRENAKQSEEIRDSTYLADSLRARLEHYDKNCVEHKNHLCERAKEVNEKFKEQEKVLEEIRDLMNKSSNNKLILIVQVITSTIIVIGGIIGTFMGWIKFG